jgi:REP-associated tyrosine transposase
VILAYHIVFSAYGFWLPNDPRGAWSRKVWAEHLKPFGDAQKVNTRRSIAGAGHDRRRRLEAKRSLRYPAVRFNGVQAREVARGVQEAGEVLGLTVHACAVMPDHVHLVTGRTVWPLRRLRGFSSVRRHGG